jgi:hypothetical protein
MIKILFVLLLLGSIAGIASEFTIGDIRCNSSGFMRIDNGDVNIGNFQNPYANSNKYDYVPLNNNPYYIQYIQREPNKYTDVFVYTANERFLFKRRIDNDVFNSNMSDLKFDKKTFFRFRDQSVIGINFACKL